MPNTLAYLVLALWPLVTIFIFLRLEIGRAVIWSLLLAYLFLPPPPAMFDFPMMPPLSKETLPSISAFLMAWAMRGRDLKLLPKSVAARALMVVFVVSPMATVLTNDEPVIWGPVVLPSLRLLEGIALMVNQAMLLMPFVLAQNFLTRESDQRDILVALLLAGLVYSVPMLVEVRLSPQLNTWVYGYFQHIFEQMIRDGGYRPIVFLYHGLWVAMFALMALAAAAALFREADGRPKGYLMIATGYLWAVLVLCKSMASIAYSLVLVPLILFGGRLMQFRVAALLALLAVGYPVLKGNGLIPSDFLLEQATAVDPERARSLEFRFDNEDVLMERALEKPAFGWGSWGRNHVHDPVSGRVLTVADGRWVITIGVFGWVGYFAEFALLAWPIFILAARGFKGLDVARVSPWLGPLALILGFNLFDLLPNATITTLTWLLSGSMLGHLETVRLIRKQRERETLESIM
ncbi:MAG: O-antigen ligase like membrane protein [Rhodobacteraceae bacterium HLUCCO07]|nr:MAG: O-antigen ligase like membrane protein [Rhodobacteraceae bacterium HLUCCO07]